MGVLWIALWLLNGNAGQAGSVLNFCIQKFKESVPEQMSFIKESYDACQKMPSLLAPQEQDNGHLKRCSRSAAGP
jgi:hypothetical protein